MMTEFWEETRDAFLREGWKHLANAAEEIRQYWDSVENPKVPS